MLDGARSGGRFGRGALSVIVLLGSLVACRPRDARLQASDALEARLDSLVPGLLARHGTAGVAIALVRDGRLAWSRGYGFADKERGRRVDSLTRFNVGSISKTVTAWAVMTLVEEGRIELDAPIERYLRRWHLPASRFDRSGVTVRRVLSHTAGLGIYVVLNRPVEPPPAAGLPTLEKALSGVGSPHAGLEVVAEPGSQFQYTNGGFALLQLVVEEVSGERFADYVARRLLVPLEMRSTGYDWTADLDAHVATPYDPEGHRLPQAFFVEQGSGGVFTTAADLGRFAAASSVLPSRAGDGRVLRRTSIEEMLSPAAATDGQYGLGYRTNPPVPGIRLVVHDGSNDGWFALMVVAPDRGDGLVVLTNRQGGGVIASPILCVWLEGLGVDTRPICPDPD